MCAVWSSMCTCRYVFLVKIWVKFYVKLKETKLTHNNKTPIKQHPTVKSNEWMKNKEETKQDTHEQLCCERTQLYRSKETKIFFLMHRLVFLPRDFYGRQRPDWRTACWRRACARLICSGKPSIVIIRSPPPLALGIDWSSIMIFAWVIWRICWIFDPRGPIIAPTNSFGKVTWIRKKIYRMDTIDL